MATEKDSLHILETLFYAGKYEDAIKTSKKFLQEFPSSFQIGFIRCKSLLKSGKFNEAESEIDNLLTKFPENINLLVEKGFLILRKGLNTEAKVFFEKALFLDPFNQRAKKGISEIKKNESGEEASYESPMSFVSYEKEKAGLEDTISESDLEKLMELKNIDNLQEASSEESLPAVSISFEDSSIQRRDELLIPDIDNVPEINEKSNIETALEELNKLSETDLKDLKVEDEAAEVSSVVNEEKKENENAETDNSSFVTESAASLYLKQGLYDDAVNVYFKLYKQADPNMYKEKVELINRVRLLQTKVVLLKNLMNKMKRSGDSIV